MFCYETFRNRPSCVTWDFLNVHLETKAMFRIMKSFLWCDCPGVCRPVDYVRPGKRWAASINTKQRPEGGVNHIWALIREMTTQLCKVWIGWPVWGRGWSRGNEHEASQTVCKHKKKIYFFEIRNIVSVLCFNSVGAVLCGLFLAMPIFFPFQNHTCHDLKWSLWGLFPLLVPWIYAP